MAMRTRDEIQDLLDAELPDGPGSMYEEGVQDALLWASGESDSPPLP